jgi:hypothetical protein
MLRIRPSGATLSCWGGMALVWVVVLVVVLPSDFARGRDREVGQRERHVAVPSDSTAES